MLTAAQLTQSFGRNINILQSQTAGLTHADSLLQPPFRGNCLNWVLGHLANNRDHLLESLGAAAITGATNERYGHGSEPVTADGPDVLPMEVLLKQLVASQEIVAAALAALTPEDLAREVRAGQRTMTLAERIFFFYFHETYHVGQTELLRQLTGVNDKII